MKRVIIIGCHNIGFSLIRSLADKGLKIVALVTSDDDYCQYARPVQEWHRVPSPRNSRQGFVDWLIMRAAQWKGAFLLPASDTALEALCLHRELILKYYHASLPSLDILQTLMHKGRLYHAARDLGIKVPNYYEPKTLEELRHLQFMIQFPCVLKPCENGALFVSKFRQKAFFCDSYGQLEYWWKKAHTYLLEVMICDFVPGPDDRLFCYINYLSDDGSMLGEICVQKLRQHPPRCGIGRVVRTVPMIELLRASLQKILNKYGYSGFSETEFKWDERDGEYKLIEINLRPVLHESLFTMAGVNFSYLAFQDKVFGVCSPVESYKVGLYWSYLPMDILDILRYRKWRESWMWRDYFAPYMQPWISLIPFWEDPFVFVCKAKSSILKIIRERCKDRQ